MGKWRLEAFSDISLHGALTDPQISRLAEIAERTPVTLAIREGLPIDTHFQGKV